MTKATRVGFKLDQLLSRSPTAGLSVSSGHRDAKYFRGGAMNDAVTPPAYTITARVLHWITAILILSMIPLGVVIANEWGGSAQDSLYDLHRSIGAAVIPLVILRLIYRWTHSPLPLPEDIPAMQRLTAHVTHWGLYALLIVQPLTGWIGLSGAGDRFWLVRVATDLAREPRIFRAAFLSSQPDRDRHRLPCGRAYRRGALPSFCA